MFNTFSAYLFRAGITRGYRLCQPEAEGQALSDTPYWVIEKGEDTSFCRVHVIDCDKANLPAIADDHADYMRRLEPLSAHFKNLFVLYILASENDSPPPPNQESMQRLLGEAQVYVGQPLYAVFWRVRFDTQAVTVPEGQPASLFGLHTPVKEALGAAAGGDTQEARCFGDIRRQAHADSPYAPLRKRALFTYGLVIINALVLLLMYLKGYPADPMTPARFGAIVPALILYDHQYYRLLTAVFVHFGWAHFFMNATGLLIFGTRVERYLGRVRFLLIYLFSGLCGSLMSLWLTRGYAAGASGAVYGLTGAVFAYTWVSKHVIDRLTGYTLLIYIGIGLAMGFAIPGIDNFGHIGGLAAGVLSGIAATRTLRPKPGVSASA